MSDEGKSQGSERSPEKHERGMGDLMKTAQGSGVLDAGKEGDSRQGVAKDSKAGKLSLSNGQKIALTLMLKTEVENFYFTAEHRRDLVPPGVLYARLTPARQAFFREKAKTFHLPEDNVIKQDRGEFQKTYGSHKEIKHESSDDPFLRLSAFLQAECLKIYVNHEDALRILETNRIHSALLVGELSNAELQELYKNNQGMRGHLHEEGPSATNEQKLQRLNIIKQENEIVMTHINGWHSVILHQARNEMRTEHKVLSIDDLYNHPERMAEIIKHAQISLDTGKMQKKLSKRKDLPSNYRGSLYSTPPGMNSNIDNQMAHVNARGTPSPDLSSVASAKEDVSSEALAKEEGSPTKAGPFQLLLQYKDLERLHKWKKDLPIGEALAAMKWRVEPREKKKERKKTTVQQQNQRIPSQTKLPDAPMPQQQQEESPEKAMNDSMNESMKKYQKQMEMIQEKQQHMEARQVEARKGKSKSWLWKIVKYNAGAGAVGGGALGGASLLAYFS